MSPLCRVTFCSLVHQLWAKAHKHGGLLSDTACVREADRTTRVRCHLCPLIPRCGLALVSGHVSTGDMLRAEANAKNKFGKTAADYANKHGHGKKCIPILNEAIQRQLDDAMTLGFEIDEEDDESVIEGDDDDDIENHGDIVKELELSDDSESE